VTQHAPWVLQTIESNVIGATVGAIVGGTVSGLYKRAVRLEARRIEAALLALDHLLGGNAAETIQLRKGTMNPTLAQYRKAVAAGFGVILIGVLTWVESANLEPILGPLVPPMFRPLVGVLLGGIALTVSVIRSSNAPKPDAGAVFPDLPVTMSAYAPAASAQLSPTPSPSIASLVAGVTPAVASENPTSVVTLLDVPSRSYQ
jgi:hypothetical protein